MDFSLKRLALAFIFLAPGLVQAYPEMVRHGYINCTTCHVSPTGGGVITRYGRELSKEVLSMFATDAETPWAYGVVKPPEWLTLGGDIRSVYAYRDTAKYRDGRFIFMQGDLEAAAQKDAFTLVGTLGYQNPDRVDQLSDHLISRRHYLMFHASDEVAVRFGRFLPAYGINTPDHIIATKAPLGFDEGMESYNLEASYIGDAGNFYLSGIFGRIDNPDLKRDTGIMASASRGVADHYKVGVSYLYGTSDLHSRHALGPFGILAFSPRFFLLTETDFVRETPLTTAAHWGVLQYNRLDYELLQGLHLYFAQELNRGDFKQSLSEGTSYGGGLQIFPRPHFEVNLFWSKRQDPYSLDVIDYAYLMFHFYL